MHISVRIYSIVCANTSYVWINSCYQYEGGLIQANGLGCPWMRPLAVLRSSFMWVSGLV